MTTKKSQNSVRNLQLRKDRDYACAYLKGKKIMLGRWGTPEADANFRQLQIQVLTDPTLTSLQPEQVTVDDLCFGYLQYAKEYDPGHFFSIKTAITILLQGFSGQAVNSLDTRHFLHLQDRFVQHGVSRQYCNSLMRYIRAMLKWGSLRKLVSPLVLAEATLVPAIKKGKTTAYEKPQRQDVPDEIVDRTLQFLLPTLRDMVQVQRLSTMRPSETCRMKPGEIDTEYTTAEGVNIWMYTPGTHKSSWREKSRNGEYVRIIPLGKTEQEIIAPRLVSKADEDFIFSPKDTMQEKYARDAANRKTKVQPSQIKRKERNAKKSRRKDRDCYSRDSYNRAIHRAIIAANKFLPKSEQIQHWTPYQLRHAAVTAITLETGSVCKVAGSYTHPTKKDLFRLQPLALQDGAVGNSQRTMQA
jgi:integrase